MLHIAQVFFPHGLSAQVPREFKIPISRLKIIKTDRLGGKESWRPTHFSLYQTFFLHFPNELCYGYL